MFGHKRRRKRNQTWSEPDHRVQDTRGQSVLRVGQRGQRTREGQEESNRTREGQEEDKTGHIAGHRALPQTEFSGE